MQDATNLEIAVKKHFVAVPLRYNILQVIIINALAFGIFHEVVFLIYVHTCTRIEWVGTDGPLGMCCTRESTVGNSVVIQM